MTDVQLDTSYLDGGITTVNFFNGRVLTAEDLRSQQTGLTDRDRRIARSLGDGVATGFRVTRRAAETLAVEPGLAINPMGDVLELAGEGVDVPLVVVDEEETSVDAGFSPCTPGSASGLTGEGVYVFCVTSASADKGGTPGVDFDSGGTAVSCGPRYTIEGLAFRLVPVDVAGLASAAGLDSDDLDVLATPEGGDRDKLRNVLSHLFLGTSTARASYSDAFGAALRVPLDELRSDGMLTPCDVPLAVVTWLDSGPAPGIEIVDRWAVRREVVPAPSPALAGLDGWVDPVATALLPGWSWLVSRHRRAERFATFVQFQQQLGELLEATALHKLRHVESPDHFRYLPAAGLVPVNGGVLTRRAFDAQKFFAGVPVAATGRIAGARVEPLLRASLAYPPVDVGAGEAIFVYTVAENEDLVTGGTGGAMPFVVFSSTAIEFHGQEDLEITAVFPSGPLHPGDAIEVRGHGFGFTTGTARVFFDEIRKDPLPGSTDRKLLVIVPEEISVPEEGRAVTLKAENGELSDSVLVTVVPLKVDLGGEIDVTWVSVEPETLSEGEEASFVYTIKSRLNQTADIAVAVTSVPDSLESEITLLDGDGTPIDALEAVGVEEERELVVHVNELSGVHPEDPAEAAPTVTLTVSASAEGVTQSDIRVFTIGETIEPPDEEITFEVDGLNVTTGGAEAGSWDGATSTITLAEDAVGVLNVLVGFARDGKFVRSFTHSGVTVDGWNVAFTGSAGEEEDVFDVEEGDLEPDGVDQRESDIAVMAGPEASPTASFTVVVHELDSEKKQTKTFHLVRSDAP